MASTGIAAGATTSATPVSTGSGVQLTQKNAGIVSVLGQIEGFATGNITRLNYAVYLSTTGIPVQGAGPALGDLQIGPTSVFDPSITAQNITLPLTGFKSAVFGVFYVYVVFWSGNGVNTNNVNDGRIVVNED